MCVCSVDAFDNNLSHHMCTIWTFAYMRHQQRVHTVHFHYYFVCIESQTIWYTDVCLHYCRWLVQTPSAWRLIKNRKLNEWLISIRNIALRQRDRDWKSTLSLKANEKHLHKAEWLDLWFADYFETYTMLYKLGRICAIENWPHTRHERKKQLNKFSNKMGNPFIETLN